MLTLHKGKNTKKVNQCLTWIDYCLIWVTEFFLQKKIVHIYPNPWYTISGTLVIHYGIQYCKDTSTWSVTELIVVRSRKILKYVRIWRRFSSEALNGCHAILTGCCHRLLRPLLFAFLFIWKNWIASFPYLNSK